MRPRLTASVLLAGLALGAAGCGAAKTVTPTPETVIGTVPQESTPTVNPSQGDPAAGKDLFTSNGCAGCHAYSPAGSTAAIGPNLDTTLKGKDANFVLTSIVDPNAQIAPGYQAGIMPTTFGQSLNDKQLADLVAFLTQPSS